MQTIQNIAELRTHEKISCYPDDLAKALEFYGARIGRDLGILHELTEGKIAIGAIVEMASIFEHLVQNDDTPSSTPAEFFNEQMIPFMETAPVITKEEHPDGINVDESSDSPKG